MAELERPRGPVRRIRTSELRPTTSLLRSNSIESAFPPDGPRVRVPRPSAPQLLSSNTTPTQRRVWELPVTAFKFRPFRWWFEGSLSGAAVRPGSFRRSLCGTDVQTRLSAKVSVMPCSSRKGKALSCKASKVLGSEKMFVTWPCERAWKTEIPKNTDLHNGPVEETRQTHPKASGRIAIGTLENLACPNAPGPSYAGVGFLIWRGLDSNQSRFGSGPVGRRSRSV